MNFDHFFMGDDQCNFDEISSVLVPAVDSVAVCSRKISSTCYLIVSCSNNIIENKIMKNIIDLYFSFTLNCNFNNIDYLQEFNKMFID